MKRVTVFASLLGALGIFFRYLDHYKSGRAAAAAAAFGGSDRREL